MGDILVEEYRGDILECVHRGYICCVDEYGQVIYSIGDPNFVTYMRSSAKPIQVIPLIKRGLEKKYNLSNKEITVMAGSHRAEPFHVNVLESIMKKVKVEEEELICLPTYPLATSAKEEILRQGGEKRRIYHNCSGKHMGILTLCTDMECDKKDYWNINSPAQQEILSHISMISGYPREDIKIGTDGCGVPVFGMPMKNLAKAYMTMACPDTIEDELTRNAVIKITKLINENYEMVSGTNLICSLLLMDDNIVAKGGAKGVYCFGLKEERLGFSIKIIDGSEDEWPLIVASILEQIDYKNKDTIDRIRDIFPIATVNDNNKIVGESIVKFKLK
ncbi:asparaginase [Clostridium sp. UBA1056]|uniref:asparaginase n=1 Tax=unclassified Clostridium TaxID=2614128 RepID=UPI0032162F51